MTALAHRLLPLALLAVAVVSVVVMSCAPRAAWAQTALTLADFDDTGLDVEIAVLIETGASIFDGTLYARAQFGADGDLLDGGTGGVIPFLSAPAHPDDPAVNDGNLIRIRRLGASGLLLNEPFCGQPKAMLPWMRRARLNCPAEVLLRAA